jgi:predicted DNA-binding transcriptional regulator YafY
MVRHLRQEAKNQALIYLQILGKLSRTSSRTARQILDSLRDDGVDIELLSLQRALKAMREEPKFHIECDDTTKPFGYRLSKSSPFAMSSMTPSESLLLQLSGDFLRYLLPASVTRAMGSLFDSARVSMQGQQTRDEVKAWRSKIAVVPNQLSFVPPKILPRILDTVTEALFRNRVLLMSYTAPDPKNNKKDVAVEPLGLVQQDHRIYLVAQYEGTNQIRHFALHRFTKAEVTDRAFSPKGFSLRQYVSERHFNYTDGELRMVRLSFELTGERTVFTLRETPFNETQVIEELAPGLWRVTVEIADSVLLDGWLAAWKERAGIRNVVKESLQAKEEGARAE